MVAGQKAVTSLIAVLGKGLAGKALVGALAGPVGVGLALIAGAGYGIYQHFKKKAIEKFEASTNHSLEITLPFATLHTACALMVNYPAGTL